MKNNQAEEALCYIDGSWRKTERPGQVTSPYSGEIVTKVFQAELSDVKEAICSAVNAKERVAALAGFERASILRRAAALLRESSAEIAWTLASETGKTIRDCDQELVRAAEVLDLCAEEAVRIEGRHVPLDASKVGAERVAIGLRFPVGVVAAIIPFNAPVNLTCHKVGPSFAAGNTTIIKSPPQAPRTSQLIVEVLAKAGFPKGSIALLHGDGSVGEALVTDAAVDFISFTGSPRTGVAIKAVTGLRGCILELGGVGPTIVHSDADLDLAAQMCTQAGFRLAGQSCASVQNLFVHESRADDFTNRILALVGKLRTGDPLSRDTDIGPVINSQAAERIVSWVQEARDAGAEILCGGTREGNIVEPTLVSRATEGMKVVCEEVFGPVIVIRPYEALEDVYRWIQASNLGLNCGLFTKAHAVALEAVRQLPCASVVVNGTCTFRPDQIPYGGLRGSGYGRESPHDSIRAMTQERFLVL
ncbi:MAG: aldehyde dehydrogenase family protein [Rhizobiaceae bacterium]